MSTPLHQSILSGSVMSAGFLLLNGGKINALDERGNTPLHLAVAQGSTGQVFLHSDQQTGLYRPLVSIFDFSGLPSTKTSRRPSHSELFRSEGFGYCSTKF